MKLLKVLRRFILKYTVPRFIWPESILVDSVEIPLRRAPYSFGIKWMLLTSVDNYEKPERSMLKYINYGDRVLELGGSIGILTALLAVKVGSVGSVLSVEADDKLVAYSRTWLQNYKNVIVKSKIAFPIYERTNLRATFDNTNGSLGGKVQFDLPGNALTSSDLYFLSDVETLDKFCPNILFVDIEGSEELLLKMDAKLPEYIKKVFIELHPYMYGEVKLKKIIASIEGEGFMMIEKNEDTYYFKRRT